MAKLFTTLATTTATVLVLVAGSISQAADEGKEVIGKVQSTLYIGTNGDASKLGRNAKALDTATAKKLRATKKMKFTHYRKLGSDTQPIFRSYENWLTPLKPSEEILLSFEARGRSHDNGIRLDLEFWQMRRKVMKTDSTLKLNKPLYILGPKWRGGQIIIEVKLIEITPQK